MVVLERATLGPNFQIYQNTVLHVTLRFEHPAALWRSDVFVSAAHGELRTSDIDLPNVSKESNQTDNSKGGATGTITAIIKRY